MITVTVCGVAYSCAVAFKGPNYVRLVDSTGSVVASFNGVNDFSCFAIAGGTWTNVTCNNVALGIGLQYGTELPETGVEGQLFFKLN